MFVHLTIMIGAFKTSYIRVNRHPYLFSPPQDGMITTDEFKVNRISFFL